MTTSESIIYIDIETVSQFENLDSCPIEEKRLWQIKSQYWLNQEGLTAYDSYTLKAGIYAEFSKVVCISVGYIRWESNGQRICYTKSFVGKNECKVLGAFKEMIELHERKVGNFSFCGHNIREFDIPFICRRLLINGMSLPGCLKLYGKKPWELSHLLDTMQFWRFGDYKNYTSLDLLCRIFKIESPKTDLSGADIHAYYWKGHALDKIRLYCEKDVFSVACLFNKLMMQYPESDIIHQSVHQTE